MAVVVGIFVGQDWSGIPWFEAGAAPGAVAPFSFGSLLRTKLHLTGSVESKKCAENFANATGEQGYPGGKFFDPLCLAGTLKDGVYIPDAEKLERLKLASSTKELPCSMLIFHFEAGQGMTPLGALGL
ncbi:chlorophyll a-b binding CP24 10A, chloroplastic [Olea europaea subsp. europaea]|uniref:Chlorophyll a-b binding CP24 10A, chloroplastic n=1 Tax=Olea europaea subsp. europaea TaxID=158383 RepID=A0A8S0THT0_OLEEU|nr:chlorophyll a-b binding CP24 10A, chloroplastic [Olea europaea subsp. europaea]